MNYTYDANNRLIQAKQSGSVVGSYVYDGAGKRVKKVDTSTTIFVYNILGQMVAEYSDAATSSAGGTSYLTSDILGSPRAFTNSSGEVIAHHDYLPFGEEISAGIGGRDVAHKYAADHVRQKFTGYERDEETGLDFAQARYYASSVGRFTSIDPLTASASPSDPQTFNRYTYVRNNPLRYVDPTGLTDWPSSQDSQQPCVALPSTGQLSILLTGSGCPPPGIVGSVDIRGEVDPIPTPDGSVAKTDRLNIIHPYDLLTYLVGSNLET